MTVRSVSTFKYVFRAPGSRVVDSIRFAVGQTTLGLVMVGRSQRGVCAIFLGDDAMALQAQLAAAFPTNELRVDQAALALELRQVIAFIDNEQPAGVIDLDICGTAFQQKVWQALCEIPAGQTRSYSDVARDLGTPEAVRAVAGACASNVMAIAIPCHRVVRSDGSVSGYRWGVERKLALLAEECAQ
ncbi:methylated-DNA--[protein]-cysteine S-methyltransferase [Burkholderia lata]|uniref:methylated-DNA--[protein]-cysteine S-methyltransferase n=1 Tax=Burkholderia lata (strain ATCC 17760 / DSM 23089 / LMG 22485 / NCIMB 9086 / R18194 / 383) TaxID=482957 RepID=Q39G96_BURL3|nr:methylated-DNA--[protein]-cysteine S-methyltransferase [Burkholderia lata]ABB08520.1 DNA-O6-methylguanine--protein-cysteine S-methyltransferase [Burkholderia lata]